MVFLQEVAIGFYCAIGALYAVWLLRDCWVRSRVRTGGTADGGPKLGVKPCRLAGFGEWWCQAISAGLLLIVAATMSAAIWESEAPHTTDQERLDTQLRATVLLRGLPPIAARKVLRHRVGADCPIVGIDLADEPITDANLRELSKELEETKFLIMPGTHITDDGLTYLKKIPGLKELILARTRVTDAGCKSLAQITTLEDLWLSDTSITDDGLKSLGSLPNLKRLSVANTAITDAGLRSLENLERLERLDLHGTQVSKQGAAALKEKLRSLKRVAGP